MGRILGLPLQSADWQAKPVKFYRSLQNPQRGLYQVINADNLIFGRVVRLYENEQMTRCFNFRNPSCRVAESV